MFMDIQTACMTVHQLYAQCSQRTEEGLRFPGTGVTVSCMIHACSAES